MTSTPIDDASALAQRVRALLVDAHLIRQRLIAMAPADTGEEAERQVFLGIASALEAGLRRSLEEAITTLKTLKGDDAETWLRRR